MKLMTVLILILIFIALSLIIPQGDSMTTLSHEIHINAVPEKVWQVLNNLEEVSAYNPTVAHARYTSDSKEGIGAARECELKAGGKIKERIIAVASGQSVTMELYESEWPVEDMKWTTTIRSENHGTVVTQKTEYRPKGLIGKILNPIVMKRNMNSTIADVFAELKKYIEAK